MAKTATIILPAEPANDHLEGGFGGNDTLVAGAGDDTLIGGDVVDKLYGEDGNDWLAGQPEMICWMAASVTIHSSAEPAMTRSTAALE